MPDTKALITPAEYTALEIETIYQGQHQFFKSGVTKPYAFRKAQLNVLKAAIKRHEQMILDALQKDLGKSNFESFATEVGLVYGEIDHVLKHLQEWMRSKRVATPLTFFPSTSKIHYDPLGTVLIISPWNYPFNLAIMPLVAAMAGGNTVILKPSELATETEIIINTIIAETFEPEYIATVNGSGQLVSHMIETHHFDHIFFTGSTAVGKKIMQAAAKQLSPVTLELGGKSPCIVAEDASISFAAKKIAWSKWINAGQTCVAPDYLLVHERVKDKLVQQLIAVTEKMFGKDPQQSPDYPRIINEKRWRTITGYLQEGNILYGGASDIADRYIAPTIIDHITAGDSLAQEEIFGPVLPIITYKNREEVLQWVEKNPYPLACYIYTANKKTAAYFTGNIRFGGGCINNGLVHLGIPDLPFGGVGYSGMGQYHGKDGFLSFTHQKSMFTTPTWLDMPLMYAPFKDHIKYLRKLMR